MPALEEAGMRWRPRAEAPVFDGLPIETAPIALGAEFGPCLLWAATDDLPERWLIGW
ncbi:MAG TPA: hypothetical protein VGM07_06215 [Stellaceae bacterium]|jgi:hypothetical protein